jgi:hypothetical protein
VILVLFINKYQFLQLPFLFLASAYTATQAGALVYITKNMLKKEGSLHSDKQNYKDEDEYKISNNKRDDSEFLELNNSKFEELSVEEVKSLTYNNIM